MADDKDDERVGQDPAAPQPAIAQAGTAARNPSEVYGPPAPQSSAQRADESVISTPPRPRSAAQPLDILNPGLPLAGMTRPGIPLPGSANASAGGYTFNASGQSIYSGQIRETDADTGAVSMGATVGNPQTGIRDVYVGNSVGADILSAATSRRGQDFATVVGVGTGNDTRALSGGIAVNTETDTYGAFVAVRSEDYSLSGSYAAIPDGSRQAVTAGFPLPANASGTVSFSNNTADGSNAVSATYVNPAENFRLNAGVRNGEIVELGGSTVVATGLTSRTEIGAGLGVGRDTFQVSANLDHKFNPRESARLSGTYSSTEGQGDRYRVDALYQNGDIGVRGFGSINGDGWAVGAALSFAYDGPSVPRPASRDRTAERNVALLAEAEASREANQVANGSQETPSVGVASRSAGNTQSIAVDPTLRTQAEAHIRRINEGLPENARLPVNETAQSLAGIAELRGLPRIGYVELGSPGADGERRLFLGAEASARDRQPGAELISVGASDARRGLSVEATAALGEKREQESRTPAAPVADPQQQAIAPRSM
ncbi:hypothetical protein [Lysobacter sp. Root604]|uniref:hypothetical protein n=1 Tax=Lysobacter sp. Root604 TaxID=1736568 RepID=UPI0012FC8B0C|nr:hypothetical protein [Lysobacter sp. Root604]